MSYWRQPLDRNQFQIARGIVHVIDERCKGCGFCIEFCPRGLLKISKRVNSKGYHPPDVVDDYNCTNCGLCALLCPDFAVYTEDGGTRFPDQVSPINKSEDR